MTTTEIKKILYKEKPVAKHVTTLTIDKQDLWIYQTTTSQGVLTFQVPLLEMEIKNLTRQNQHNYL